MTYFDFFQVYPLPYNMIHGHYNFYLVALSYIVAVLTSFVALEFASYLRREKSKIVWGALIGGAFAMGAGIFSMHFVGMLAFITPMPMGYGLPLTLTSLLFAVTGSAIALFVVRKPRLSVMRIMWGGVIIGLVIAGMHYIGMSAMIAVDITYLPSYFSLSILIAVIAGMLVLWLMLQCDTGSRARRNSLKAASSLVLGGGICGMHYTGMAAAVIVPHAEMTEPLALMAISPEKLSFLIACVAALILFVGLYVIGRQLSILLKLLFGYLIILLMMGPIAYTSLENITSITNSFTSITNAAFPKIVALLEMKAISARIGEIAANLGKEELSGGWAAGKSALLTELQNLENHEQAYLTAVSEEDPSSNIQQLSDLKNSIHEISLNLAEAEEEEPSELLNLQQELKRADNALNQFIERQIFLENQNLTRMQENVLILERQSLTLSIVVLSVVSAIVVFLSLFISFRISRPIIQLSDASQEIAKGDLHKRVSIESEDEIGQLAQSFNTMAAALEISNQKRDEFVGMAAHDLRVPVSAMIVGANLLSTGSLGPLNSKQLRLTRMITTASESMMSLLDDLLSANTVKSKSIQITPKEIDLIDYMDKICDFYQLWAEKKQITLKLDIQTQEKTAFFDGNKISQVINNFLSNAIKFSGPNSSVNMVVKKINKSLRVEVHDQAGGIPDAEQPQVFTWFAKISVKPTGGEASHGLGLAICKDVIQAHKGSIGFISDYGRGSVFYFEIEAFGKA